MEVKLENLKKEIEDKMDGNKILVIQFITIDKPGGKYVIRYTYTSEDLFPKYDKAQRAFTLEETNENKLPQVSLVFDKMENDPYIDSNLNSTNVSNITSFNICEEEKLSIQDLIHFESKAIDDYDNNIKGRFKWWCKCLDNHFKSGKHTLWVNQEIDGKKGQDSFVSSIFFIFSHKLEDNVKYPVAKEARDFLVSHIVREYSSEIERNATQAAISQVMARNMSHNIGSHVLSRFITEGSFDEKIPINYTPLGFSSNGERTLKQLIADFNTYLKTRMDFLADIVFGVPTIESKKSFFNEILFEFNKNYLLLEKISGTDTFKYKIVARNLTTDQCKECLTTACPEECKQCIISENCNDLWVSIPNDILGSHAFYTILENIIRNCAKHGAGNELNHKIYIDISESEVDDYYLISIYDSVEKDLGALNKLVQDINEKLISQIIQDGKLRPGSWGLIEMQASSAYLRKVPLEEIELPKYRNVDNKNEFIIKANNFFNKYFGYNLYLLKPKEVLIIIPQNDFEKFENNLHDLRKKGICIKSISDFEKDRIQNNLSYPLLLFKGSQENYLKFIKGNNNFPIRQLLFFEGIAEYNTRFYVNIEEKDFEKFFEFLKKGDTETLINHCWDLWVVKNLAFLNLQFSGLGSATKNNLKNKNQILKDYLFTLESTGQSVRFSDHVIDECFKIINNNLNAPFYAEPYKSKDYFILNKLIRNDKKKFPDNILEKNLYIFYKLLESIFTTILIVDERIQELAEKEKYEHEGESIKITDLLYCTNIIVPKSNNGLGIDLNKSDFSSISANLIKLVKDSIKGACCNEFNKVKADFILIHLGIIEKLISVDKEWQHGKEATGIQKFIESKFEYSSDSNSKFVIISGRGKPHNLPENFLFLNYSMVSQYCFENRLKYYLNELIYSSKPR